MVRDSCFDWLLCWVHFAFTMMRCGAVVAADDVDADGADDNVGDNDGVFFSLALAQANGLAQITRDRGAVENRPAGPLATAARGKYTRPLPATGSNMFPAERFRTCMSNAAEKSLSARAAAR